MAYRGTSREHAIALAGSPPAWGFEHYIDGEPPLHFFAHPPRDSLSRFSTENGKKPRRLPPFDFTSGQGCMRALTVWDASTIQNMVDNITAVPANLELRKHIREPRDYLDLYDWWDAWDIWHLGAQNLWNVLNHLHYEAQMWLPTILNESRQMMQCFIHEKLQDGDCVQRMLNWHPTSCDPDPISVFTLDELGEVQGLDTWYIEHLRNTIKETIRALRSGSYVAPSTNIWVAQAGEPSIQLVDP
jgi:hypothetical protein